MMSLDREGHVIDTDKGVWQQCRFTWLLGELYNNVEPRDEWLELATQPEKFRKVPGYQSMEPKVPLRLTDPYHSFP